MSDFINGCTKKSVIKNIEEIVRDLKLTVISVMNNQGKSKTIDDIVDLVLFQCSVDSYDIIRREYDGNTEASYLVEKMIGEFLIGGQNEVKQ